MVWPQFIGRPTLCQQQQYLLQYKSTILRYCFVILFFFYLLWEKVVAQQCKQRQRPECCTASSTQPCRFTLFYFSFFPTVSFPIQLLPSSAPYLKNLSSLPLPTNAQKILEYSAWKKCVQSGVFSGLMLFNHFRCSTMSQAQKISGTGTSHSPGVDCFFFFEVDGQGQYIIFFWYVISLLPERG